MQSLPALSLLSLVLSSLPLSAEKFAPGTQTERAFKVSESQTIPYLLYLPKNFAKEPDKKWPLMLFLHGRGESRGPLSIVAKWGPPRMVARGEELPYILISPQCPADSFWTKDDQQDGLIQLLDHLSETFPVDPTRVYLTGLSMGGYGSWKLAGNYPERFAAVAPICGRGDPTLAQKLKDLPIWVFHGVNDSAVPYKHSVTMVEAIEKAGGKKIRFTSLEHTGHNSWSAAYATPELFQWFNNHRRRE